MSKPSDDPTQEDPEQDNSYHGHVIAEEDRIPLKEKIAFGAGGTARGFQETADNALMMPVFVQGVGIEPSTMGNMSLIYRVFDGITDPLMGVISDNTRTRWGRRRPYFILGSILMAISMPLVFSFDGGWSVTAITWYMLFSMLFIYFAQTVFNIPYQAMQLESTPDSHERTNLIGFSAMFGFFLNVVVGWSWYVANLEGFKIEGATVDILNGAFWVISGFAVLVLLLGLLPAIFMKERYYTRTSQQKKIGVIRSFQLSFRSKPFLILIGFVLFFLVGFNLKWGLEWFVRYHYVCGGDDEQASILMGASQSIQAFASLCGIVLTVYLSRRIGKLRTIKLLVFAMFLVGIAMYWSYNPEYPWLSVVPGVLFGPAMSGMWVMVPSMTGDIVDDDELKTGERREGAFASVFSWLTKFGMTIAGLLSGHMVNWTGYTSEMRKAALPIEIVDNMRLVLAVVPAAIVGVALVFLFFYPITERVIDENRRKLEARRGKV